MDSPATPVCLLCCTNDHAVELYYSNVEAFHLNPDIFSARRLPDRIHETIVRCTRCGLVYPRKLIDADRLSSLYQASRFTYSGEERYIRRTYHRYLQRLTQLLTLQPRPWSYLDIGCGNGFMLTTAREMGFDEVSGVEPSGHAIAQAHTSVQGRIRQGMFSRFLFPAERFDAISCFQTLDHIPDPISFVGDCFSLLKPGGAVLFINHNIASWSARLLRERCPMIDIEHTFLHTPHTMRELFARSGFTDIQTFAVRNDYPVHYWLHLLPFSRGLKAALIKLLKNRWLGRVVLPLYAGNLGLIARRPAAVTQPVTNTQSPQRTSGAQQLARS